MHVPPLWAQVSSDAFLAAAAVLLLLLCFLKQCLWFSLSFLLQKIAANHPQPLLHFIAHPALPVLRFPKLCSDLLVNSLQTRPLPYQGCVLGLYTQFGKPKAMPRARVTIVLGLLLVFLAAGAAASSDSVTPEAGDLKPLPEGQPHVQPLRRQGRLPLGEKKPQHDL